MKVLYATDGRPPAVAAGELLRKLVDPARVTVTILHAPEFGNQVAADKYAALVFEQAEDAFHHVGIGTERLRVDGEPADSVAKELAQDEYDASVLGAGNHSWLSRIVFGSVSTHLLHVVSTPVLVVHRSPDPGHERLHVLVGADGSPSATDAIGALASITTPNRVDVAVRTVVGAPELGFGAYPGIYAPASYIEEVLAEREVAAGKHLNAALDRLRLVGFDAKGSVGSGWPAIDLLDHGEKTTADLIVVGARGVGAIERMTMGSVSAHVARHSPAALVAHARVHPGDIDEPATM
jgi:nucleotide-binding universal stress UspA family protein